VKDESEGRQHYYQLHTNKGEMERETLDRWVESALKGVDKIRRSHADRVK